jgi:hypothetical protein
VIVLDIREERGEVGKIKSVLQESLSCAKLLQVAGAMLNGYQGLSSYVADQYTQKLRKPASLRVPLGP